MNERYGWTMMYLGAFAALRIDNAEMASGLAELTRSDDDAIKAIAMMRDGKAGDRVYPALEWLRMKREQVTTFTVRQRITHKTPGPEGNIITQGWETLVRADSYEGALERAGALAHERGVQLAVFAGESMRRIVLP